MDKICTRASDCAATIQGLCLFKEIRYFTPFHWKICSCGGLTERSLIYLNHHYLSELLLVSHTLHKILVEAYCFNVVKRRASAIHNLLLKHNFFAT